MLALSEQIGNMTLCIIGSLGLETSTALQPSHVVGEWTGAILLLRHEVS